MSDDPIHELAARLARGEEAAFAELYDACADRLHSYLVGRLGSRDVASDVLQSAFLRAVKSRRRFRAVENPVAYMFQIARNEAVRAAKRRPVSVRPLESTDVFAACVDSYVQRENAEMIATAMQKLSAADREVVELKILGGLKFREIADVVGVPQATVATRYRRALESLRPWLAKQLR